MILYVDAQTGCRCRSGKDTLPTRLFISWRRERRVWQNHQRDADVNVIQSPSNSLSSRAVHRRRSVRPKSGAVAEKNPTRFPLVELLREKFGG